MYVYGMFCLPSAILEWNINITLKPKRSDLYINKWELRIRSWKCMESKDIHIYKQQRAK